jgi:hypothetical protein
MRLTFFHLRRAPECVFVFDDIASYAHEKVDSYLKLSGYNLLLVKSLASSCVKLYEGHKVLELAACGLKLEACCSTLEACRLHLEQLGA